MSEKRFSRLLDQILSLQSSGSHPSHWELSASNHRLNVVSNVLLLCNLFHSIGSIADEKLFETMDSVLESVHSFGREVDLEGIRFLCSSLLLLILIVRFLGEIESDSEKKEMK